jgi:hypothetical protein
MTRRRHDPGVVRITCTDRCHEGTGEWARYGHYWLLNLREIQARDRIRLIVPGAMQRTRVVQTTTPDGSVVLFERPEDPYTPIKQFRLAGLGLYLFFEFRCPCGRNPKPREDVLLGIAARHRQELPGKRVEIDLVRLERILGHNGGNGV